MFPFPSTIYSQKHGKAVFPSIYSAWKCGETPIFVAYMSMNLPTQTVVTGRKMAVKMAETVGIFLHPLSVGIYDIAVIGTGAGLVMAAADYFADCYPKRFFAIADMPGYLTLAQRCLGIDYIASTFPTVLCMWNGLRNGDEYPRYLKERRDFNPGMLWVYTRGLENERAMELWLGLGAHLIPDIWRENPLGNLPPMQTGRLLE